MPGLEKVVKSILRAKNIVITCHLNPDGDCIGSLLALGLGLASIGKKVCMLSHDHVPARYKKLPGADKINKRPPKAPDMAITVDCNSQEMVGRPFDIIKKAGVILEIDHHDYRRPFGDISFIDTRAAAVGEMIFPLLRRLRVNITKDIARNILTSIIVETNSFRLPVVRPETFGVCARLLETGVDFHKVSEVVYWSKTKEGSILSGTCMANLKLLMNGRLAWTMVRREDFIRTGGRHEDVDTVANDMLSIDTVMLALFFREESRKSLRVSLRSKGRVNVAALAAKYGGGGHFDSAGCKIMNNRRIVMEIIEAAEKLLR